MVRCLYTTTAEGPGRFGGTVPTTWRCPTQVQGGRVGMLAHLQVVHHPGLAFDALAALYDLADQ